ncbi:MAG TPA: sulfatase-like hydrolase/transferase, partial [Gemmatimonadales bacterium]|nr:sulfatase-like hydrolase/transferase [Gemmatimonadales bacterium]
SAPRANYVHTFLALASILNARYLDELPAQVGVAELSRRPADPLIEHNLLMTELRQRGYRVIFFPTSYPATRRSPLADAQIPSPDRVQPEFVSQWLWTTPIPLVHESACEMFRCRTEFLRYVPESAEFIDWKLAQLEQLAGAAEPIFAFMHLMSPHEPFIYDADCNHRRPYLPGDESGAELERVKRAYVDQVRCVNQKLLRLVRTLQERSVSPPVILLQADHGHGRFGRHLPAYAHATTDQRAERASVFAAYALPGAPAAPLPDTVTPINAMRFVLRQYLGMKLPAVDDVTYWSSDDRPYDFVRLQPGELAGPGADGE